MSQTSNETPVACTLGSKELGTQVERWEKLYAEAGIARIETHDGLRVSFRRGGAVERELRDLAAVEIECCAWADWTVQADADEPVLEVTSREDGLPVLHGFFLAG
jgi:hypothetical protein